MNLFAEIRHLIIATLEQMVAQEALPATLNFDPITAEPPRDAAHGDMATNAAAKRAVDTGAIGTPAVLRFERAAIGGPLAVSSSRPGTFARTPEALMSQGCMIASLGRLRNVLSFTAGSPAGCRRWRRRGGRTSRSAPAGGWRVAPLRTSRVRRRNPWRRGRRRPPWWVRSGRPRRRFHAGRRCAGAWAGGPRRATAAAEASLVQPEAEVETEAESIAEMGEETADIPSDEAAG